MQAQMKQAKSYYNLDKSFYANNINLAQYFNLHSLDKRLNQNETMTHAKIQLTAANYEEKPFKVTYDAVTIPDALKSRVNRQYTTFAQDCLDELKPVQAQPIGEYAGSYSKN